MMKTTTTGSVKLYGYNPLKELFLAIARNDEKELLSLLKISVTKEAMAKGEVMSLFQKNKITPSIVTYDEVEYMAGKGVVHQGIVAEVPSSFLYKDFDEVLKKEEEKEESLFVILDELEDPHNVGAIIRSAVAFGASAIILPEHGQVAITGTVIKTSSGMNFSIPIVKVNNVNTIIAKLKERHFWVYGLTGDGDTSLADTKLDKKMVLVVGAEGKGIREKTLELCDFKLSIPINNLCESLNASVATAVAMYEWRRQERE